MLLFGAEAWTLYQKQARKLCTAHMRYLVYHKNNKEKPLTNKGIIKRANVQSMEQLLLQTNLKWTDYMVCKVDNRLPTEIRFYKLTEGTWT